MTASQVCWTLTDGHAGMRSQTQGLAQAVGFKEIIEKTAKRRFPWSLLPVSWHVGEDTHHLTPESDSLTPPWPDVMIASGRQSIPLALSIKRQSGGRTFVVYLQNPRISCSYFDLVAPPAHDGLEGPNVYPTQGALHRVTLDVLRDASVQWQERFASYPRPFHVVMVGGSTNRYRMTENARDALLHDIRNIRESSEGTVFVVPSPRTPFQGDIREALSSHEGIVCVDLKRENPYLGLLALGDMFYVTNDSVNMMSEIASTGKPFYIIPLRGHKDTTPPSRFARLLLDQGIARFYEGLSETWTYTPFNDTQRIADIIRQALQTKIV